MTEKQRWMLKELDAWRQKQIEAAGRYPPSSDFKNVPARVKQAKRTIQREQALVRRWEARAKKPWEKKRAVIDEAYQDTKRIILFATVEAALKAMLKLTS